MYMNIRSVIYIFNDGSIYQNKKMYLNPDKYNVRYYILTHDKNLLLLRLRYMFLGITKSKKYIKVKKQDLLKYFHNILSDKDNPIERIFYIDYDIETIKYVNQHKLYQPDKLLALPHNMFITGNFNFI